MLLSINRTITASKDEQRTEYVTRYRDGACFPLRRTGLHIALQETPDAVKLELLKRGYPHV